MRKGRFLALASALSLVLAGPAWAQVKQGDLDLTFHSQVEVDFEVRSNYSFNDNAVDIQTREGFFTEQETRFWIDAKAGPFESRVMIEAEDFWDTQVAEGGGDLTNIEQAYGGYDFGPFKMRAGLQVFQLDPAEIVYIDDDFGVRLWNTYDWGGWNIFWVFNQEGSDASTATPNDDRHFFMGNLDLKVAGWTLTPFVAYVNDQSQGPLSGRVTKELTAYWLGAGAKGNAAGINVLAQFTYVTGEQDIEPTGSIDIGAWAGFLSLAYPIPGSPLTVEVAGVWMSGDDSSADTDAEGYQGIFQDTELLNPQGIWIDDDIIIAPRRANVAQSCSGTAGADACAGTFLLTTDDDFSPGGTASGTSDFDFDARSAAFTAAAPTNPGNFGLQYYHAALHYKVTSNFTVSAMFAHIRAMEDALLGGDAHLGNEYTLHAVWTPHKYFRITPTLSWLVPGDAIDNLVGTDDTAFNFITEMMFLF
jgi:hypothetical protein